jgi:hypothetical protein
MKKLIVTSFATLACLGAFAQGHVRFVNDSLHLLYFTTDSTQLDPADQANAGKPTAVNGRGSLGGATLAVDLFAGTSAGSLIKVATTGIPTTGLGGSFSGANVNLPGVMANPGTYFFQVQVYDVSAGSYAGASGSNGLYYGESPIFTSTASSSPAYFSIVQHTSPAFSTWADGLQNEDAQVAGDRGAISIQMNNAIVPEPTTFALAGLGAAALLIFRRRK